jgi:glycosyltransferase involved in cell wall biosynthesis
MKVLFLAHSFPRSTHDAAGSFLLRLAVALRAWDVAVEVVAPSGEGLAGSESLAGIPVHRFRYAPRRFENLAYTGNMASQFQESWSARLTMVGFLGANFRGAVRARRQFEPDLIHAHWWFPGGLVGTWVARLAQIPLVTTMHGTDVRLARASALARPLFRHVMAHSAAVTTVSSWLAGETQRLAGINPMVAPMPVATDLFTPAQPGERATDRILFVGRLNAQKGIEHLLRAIPLSRARVSLDIVGDGPGQSELRALATTLGIGERVRWFGTLPQPALAPLYRAASVLVVPSVEEGLGLVAVEAMLCETPVIAYESGGIPDAITHGRTGMLVPAGSVAGLAEALDILLNSPDRGSALGRAGRVHALEVFSPEAAAKRYAAAYRGALDRRAS